MSVKSSYSHRSLERKKKKKKKKKKNGRVESRQSTPFGSETSDPPKHAVEANIKVVANAVAAVCKDSLSDEEGHVNRGPLCNSRKKLPVIFLEHEPHSRGSTGISRRGQVEASQVQPARSWPTGHLMPFAKHAAQESELVKERQRFERQLEHTRKEMEEAIANNDKKHVDEILKEQQKFQAKIDAIEKGREELRTDMEKLIAERERSHKEDHDAQLSEAHEARESLTHEVNQMKKQMEAQAAATQRHKEELERALELAKENEGDVQFVSLLALGALQEQAERAAKLQEEMAKEMIEREAALQRKVSQEQDLRERQMQGSSGGGGGGSSSGSSSSSSRCIRQARRLRPTPRRRSSRQTQRSMRFKGDDKTYNATRHCPMKSESWMLEGQPPVLVTLEDLEDILALLRQQLSSTSEARPAGGLGSTAR
ncbi:hypothetical protein B0T24DRAFT_594297 [Lasiosphaeria ovina]|uniref:Uncharacterized protein n=1 Tax=Lasiosphaeria ovina TaxID=92902 RepID=A0AAE0KCA3_9PEZI|nr:hypothetical protein B0T24DRAFT_594297 [Lasiosphaeria ovina]